jgi:hypothetical protein
LYKEVLNMVRGCMCMGLKLLRYSDGLAPVK